MYWGFRSFLFLDDPVYMDEEKYLEEYILNDKGVLFCGNYRQIGARPWNFGQVFLHNSIVFYTFSGRYAKFAFKFLRVMILLFKFEEGVLEICFHLLRRANGGRVNAVMMSDPVKISRTISKIVGAMSANPCSTPSAYPVCIPQLSFSSLFLFICSWIAKMMKAYSLATGLGTMKEGGSQHIGLEVPRYFFNTRKTMGNPFVLVNAGYFLV